MVYFNYYDIYWWFLARRVYVLYAYDIEWNASSAFTKRKFGRVLSIENWLNGFKVFHWTHPTDVQKRRLRAVFDSGSISLTVAVFLTFDWSSCIHSLILSITLRIGLPYTVADLPRKSHWFSFDGFFFNTSKPFS